jgi:hypothetical protein
MLQKLLEAIRGLASNSLIQTRRVQSKIPLRQAWGIFVIGAGYFVWNDCWVLVAVLPLASRDIAK